MNKRKYNNISGFLYSVTENKKIKVKRVNDLTYSFDNMFNYLSTVTTSKPSYTTSSDSFVKPETFGNVGSNTIPCNPIERHVKPGTFGNVGFVPWMEHKPGTLGNVDSNTIIERPAFDVKPEAFGPGTFGNVSSSTTVHGIRRIAAIPRSGAVRTDQMQRRVVHQSISRDSIHYKSDYKIFQITHDSKIHLYYIQNL